MTSSTPRRSAEGLAWIDARRIIRTLGEFEDKQLILVGGQALNFWQTYYSELGVTELSDTLPLTSKDIDFCGNKSAVRTCALKLNGTSFEPDIDDPTPNAGKVVFFDPHHGETTIDFIDCPHGLALRRVTETALRVTIGDGSFSVRLWVLHPVQCMFSRVHNSMGLPDYANEHALRQLSLSVVCARAFLNQMLDEGAARTVLDLAEEIYRFCHDGRVSHGRAVKARFGVDPFEAVPHDDPRLPEKFRTLRYPQMLEWIRKRRNRAGA